MLGRGRRLRRGLGRGRGRRRARGARARAPRGGGAHLAPVEDGVAAPLPRRAAPLQRACGESSVSGVRLARGGPGRAGAVPRAHLRRRRRAGARRWRAAGAARPAPAGCSAGSGCAASATSDLQQGGVRGGPGARGRPPAPASRSPWPARRGYCSCSSRHSAFPLTLRARAPLDTHATMAWSSRFEYSFALPLDALQPNDERLAFKNSFTVNRQNSVTSVTEHVR